MSQIIGGYYLLLASTKNKQWKRKNNARERFMFENELLRVIIMQFNFRFRFSDDGMSGHDCCLKAMTLTGISF